MRCRLPLILVGLAASSPAFGLDLPARKPGLWEIKMMFEGHNVPSQVVQNCIGANTDKMMNSFGGGMTKERCSKQDVQKSGDTIVVDSVCSFGAGGTSTSHAVMTGNFDSAYTVNVSSKHEGGPKLPHAAANGQTNMTIEAKWLGPCKTDQKPGDMIMANGMRMNIIEMQQMMPGRAPNKP